MEIPNTRYLAEDGWVVGRDLPLYSNRYLYQGNTNVYVMGGDRPVARLARQRCLLGTLRLFMGGFALDECAHVESRYRPGILTWSLSDPRLAGRIDITITTPQEALGMAVRIDCERAMPIEFLYGGLCHLPAGETSEQWNLSVRYQDKALKTLQYDDAWHQDNRAEIRKDGFVLESPDVHHWLGKPTYVCFAGAAEAKEEEGQVRGCSALATIHTLYFELRPDKGTPLHTPDEAFQSGVRRADALYEHLCVETPDPRIGVASAVATGEIDALWHPPKTMHGTMSWCMPLLAWDIHYGYAVLGWHDRPLALMRHYAGQQRKTDDRTSMAADPERLLTIPAKDSRFYGLGYIQEDQGFYNMQTQFFEQMIHAWRHSGDPEMARILRPALALHIRRQDACFERDGLYESVINTWPTDSVWHGGAGSVEETCFAYSARVAAADLALADGDLAAVSRYRADAERIRRAFFEKLWIVEKGHPGIYRETLGYARLHEDAWLYASFLPVDTGILTDEEQIVQALDYGRRGFLHEDYAGGGRLTWFSNWTPGIWSVREKSEGENLQLALAFFKGGMTAQGMAILKGILSKAMDSDIPCELMHPVSETGVLYARCIVEGLFGYRPDYPNGRVTISPCLPFDWPAASIRTPDFSLQYARAEGRTTLSFTLRRRAAVTVRLPLFARRLLSVEGADSYRLKPALGMMDVLLELPDAGDGHIVLHTADARDRAVSRNLRARPLEEIDLGGNIVSVRDPQGVLERVDVAAGVARIRNISGKHAFFVERNEAGYRYVAMVCLELSKTEEERRFHVRTNAAIPADARFAIIPMDSVFNGNIEGIFKQQYVSPRPETISACIGTDGFSPWTFTFWGSRAPEIRLTRRGMIASASGIPLAIGKGEKNIAFTSLWDNWPDSVEVPIGRTARMAIVNISGSTNPMQCGIENARLFFRYVDGEEEIVPLVNPDNYISLCAYPPRATNLATYMTVDRGDVFNALDAPLLPENMPELVQLGENVRSLLIRWALKDKPLAAICLGARSTEIVAGLMSVTLVV